MLRKRSPMIILFLCLALAVGMLHTLRQQAESAHIQVFRSAYPALVLLPDFEYVAETGQGFRLCSPGKPDQVTHLPADIAALLRARQLLNLRKRGDDVYFITCGAVDDESGYVITADTSINMDGLWHLDRIDGSIYRFSTMN